MNCLYEMRIKVERNTRRCQLFIDDRTYKRRYLQSVIYVLVDCEYPFLCLIKPVCVYEGEIGR